MSTVPPLDAPAGTEPTARRPAVTVDEVGQRLDPTGKSATPAPSSASERAVAHSPIAARISATFDKAGHHWRPNEALFQKQQTAMAATDGRATDVAPAAEHRRGKRGDASSKSGTQQPGTAARMLSAAAGGFDSNLPSVFRFTQRQSVRGMTSAQSGLYHNEDLNADTFDGTDVDSILAQRLQQHEELMQQHRQALERQRRWLNSGTSLASSRSSRRGVLANDGDDLSPQRSGSPTATSSPARGQSPPHPHEGAYLSPTSQAMQDAVFGTPPPRPQVEDPIYTRMAFDPAMVSPTTRQTDNSAVDASGHSAAGAKESAGFARPTQSSMRRRSNSLTAAGKGAGNNVSFRELSPGGSPEGDSRDDGSADPKTAAPAGKKAFEAMKSSAGRRRSGSAAVRPSSGGVAGGGRSAASSGSSAGLGQPMATYALPTTASEMRRSQSSPHMKPADSAATRGAVAADVSAEEEALLHEAAAMLDGTGSGEAAFKKAASFRQGAAAQQQSAADHQRATTPPAGTLRGSALQRAQSSQLRARTPPAQKVTGRRRSSTHGPQQSPGGRPLHGPPGDVPPSANTAEGATQQQQQSPTRRASTANLRQQGSSPTRGSTRHTTPHEARWPTPQYHARRVAELEVAQQQRDEEEARELTFTPRISGQSERLARRARQRLGVGEMDVVDSLAAREELAKREKWVYAQYVQTKEVPAKPAVNADQSVDRKRKQQLGERDPGSESADTDDDVAQSVVERLYSTRKSAEEADRESLHHLVDTAVANASFKPAITERARQLKRKAGHDVGGDLHELARLRAERSEKIAKLKPKPAEPRIDSVSDAIASRLPESSWERLQSSTRSLIRDADGTVISNPKPRGDGQTSSTFHPRINASSARVAMRQRQNRTVHFDGKKSLQSPDPDDDDMSEPLDDPEDEHTDALYADGKRWAQRREALRQQQADRELADCTFKPKVHSRRPHDLFVDAEAVSSSDRYLPRRGTAPAVADRTQAWEHRRQSKLDSARAQAEEEASAPPSVVRRGGEHVTSGTPGRAGRVPDDRETRRQQLDRVAHEASIYGGEAGAPWGAGEHVERQRAARDLKVEKEAADRAAFTTGENWRPRTTVPREPKLGASRFDDDAAEDYDIVRPRVAGGRRGRSPRSGGGRRERGRDAAVPAETLDTQMQKHYSGDYSGLTPGVVASLGVSSAHGTAGSTAGASSADPGRPMRRPQLSDLDDAMEGGRWYTERRPESPTAMTQQAMDAMREDRAEARGRADDVLEKARQALTRASAASRSV